MNRCWFIQVESFIYITPLVQDHLGNMTRDFDKEILPSSHTVDGKTSPYSLFSELKLSQQCLILPQLWPPSIQ